MGISSTTGLISGLNYQALISALVLNNTNSINRLTARQQTIQAVRDGVNGLSANLLSLQVSATQLGVASNFKSFSATSSDPAQLTAIAQNSAASGSSNYQVLRLAAAQQVLSRGYVNSNDQKVGAGTLTIASGGSLRTETALSSLNGGTGIRRGVIRITDRSGSAADIDLTSAATVTDVIDAINNTTGVSVKAIAHGDHLEIQDLTGQSVTNLSVTDKTGGFAAADLGILQSAAASSITGGSIYSVTGGFTLAKLNDGNQPRLAENFADLRITLSDPGATQIEVDLDGALTLNDVVGKINNASGNAGLLTASLANGRLVLTDNSGGGGAQPLSASDINGASVINALGLDTTASGNTLTGDRLGGGLNTVLLRNLRGGDGVGTLGSLSLTDRAGRTTTVDLSNATTLDDVLYAINQATDGSSNKLSLSATLNDAGNGVKITDTSGSTTSNLVIADVGPGTIAADLGIATNSAGTSVSTSSLNLRYVNESTSLSKFAPGQANVRRGTIAITDSTGAQHFVVVPEAAKTVGDVIQRINASTSGKVTAELNDTGDGFVLVDQAGGTGQLQVTEAGGKTAADLRLLGTGATGVDGKSRLSSRQATVVDISATDTLDTLVTKLNASAAGFTAAVVDDGSSFSSKRLIITAGTSGAAGNLLFDDGGLGLGLAEHTHGTDALLRLGADAASGFVLSSSSNKFSSVVSGLDLTANTVGTATAKVTVSRDSSKIAGYIQSFITAYNGLVKTSQTLTKFDSSTNQRGVLQGDAGALQVTQVLSDFVVATKFGSASNDIRTLADVGVRIQDNGTLALDSTRLQAALDKNPDAVGDLFSNSETGFGVKFKKVIESFTDPVNGQLTLKAKGLQETSDSIDTRITTLTAILQSKQDRLTQQFSTLETLLGNMQSQRTAMDKIFGASTTK